MRVGADASSLLMVDSSVWIAYFNGNDTPEAQLLDEALTHRRIGIGDLILAEVLQGFSDSREYEQAKAELVRFEIIEMGGQDNVLAAVDCYRWLRRRGVTVRGLIDCLIAASAIRGGHTLLHNDRDFDQFEKHLGLRVMHPQSEQGVGP